MIKRYIETKRRNGNSVRRLQKLKVYRVGVTASARYTFLMSDLECDIDNIRMSAQCFKSGLKPSIRFP